MTYDTVPERTTVRHTHRWYRPSAASILAGAVGVVLLILGIVALARAGIPAENLTEPVVAVGPFGRTPLFALIEVIVGLLALATAADADVRGASFLAVLTGVFGIVWVIEPSAFEPALGLTATTGWLYILVSAGLLAAVTLDRLRAA